MRPNVPILRLPDAHGLDVPKYADGVGTTLTLQAAISVPLKLDVGESALIPTGFAFTIPLGMEAQVRSHRELSEKTGLIVLNAPATIDSSYQEEVKVLLYNKGENAYIVRRGQDIASLVFSPVLRVKWDEVNPPEEKVPEKPDTTPILAQSEDENLTPSVVKEALKQATVQQEKQTPPAQAVNQSVSQSVSQTQVQPIGQNGTQVSEQVSSQRGASVQVQSGGQTIPTSQASGQVEGIQTSGQAGGQVVSQVQTQKTVSGEGTSSSVPVPPVKPPPVPTGA